MDINRILDFTQFTHFINIGIKLFGIVLSVFYIVFSVVIMRQVQVMKRTVTINDYGTLQFFSFIQLLAAILLFFYSLFIL